MTYDEFFAEAARLNVRVLPEHPNDVRAMLDAKDAEIERLRDALHKLEQWAEAYPLAVFPEPDFKRAHEVLTAAGMTLDAISASNMRHVLKRVQKIVRDALPDPGQPEHPSV